MPYLGKPINFMKYPAIYFVISGLFLVPGIISLAVNGLRPSIDFTGGSLMEFMFEKPVSTEAVQSQAPEGFEFTNVQTTDTGSLIIRSKPVSKDQNETLKTKLSEQYGAVEELRFETIGPVLGQELLKKTTIAILLSAASILSYIAYRFKNVMFGLSAIAAMFHDSLIVLGVFSLLGKYMGVEVDTLFVTALLTILSFSVHDTIVVYDRIRESMRQFPRANFVDLVNKAINETLARSINNSMTIIFMLLALWLLGGETTKWFVFALLLGTVTGTYSSTFTAAPLLVVLHRARNKKK